MKTSLKGKRYLTTQAYTGRMTRYMRQTRNVLAVAIFLFTIMFIGHFLPSNHHFADDMHQQVHRRMFPFEQRKQDRHESEKNFEQAEVRIPPPWESSLEGRQEWNYIDGEFEWDVVTPKYSYGGEEVAYKNKATQAKLVNRIFRRAIDFVDRTGDDCKKGSAREAWRVARQWDKSDFLVLVECPTSMNHAAPDAIQTRPDFPRHHIVHVPFRAGIIHSPNSFQVPETPLAIIVPIACKVQTLETFLRRTVDELENVSGSKRIVIAWGECEETPKVPKKNAPLFALSSFEQAQNVVRAEVARHRNKIPIEIVRTNIPFSRSSTLNTGIAGISDQEIAVVLDIDMTAEHPYFVHARAFTSHGGAYFPIVFSFFNPVYSKRKSHAPINVHPKLGRWRGKGYGMVAAKKMILDQVDGYNTNHSVWGLEDRELFERVKSMSGSAGAASEVLVSDGSAGASSDPMNFEQNEETSLPSSASKSSRLHVWRVHDPHLAHEWHDKQCGHLKRTNRYWKCMGSKATAEGSQIQLALKVLSQRRADGDSRN